MMNIHKTENIERRLLLMLADLWNHKGQPINAAHHGSAKHAMLGGMAMKRRWEVQPQTAWEI